jgi:hypothetical protein
MQKPDRESAPRFYFALPRLLAKLGGGSAEPIDTNWLETNAVGTLIHAIVFLFLAQLFFAGRATWQQLLLLVPLAILTLLFWMLLFALQTLIIRSARALRLAAEDARRSR